MSFIDLSSNQLRVAVDLKQVYEAYLEARRTMAGYAGGMAWKPVKGHEYLVKVINRRGGTKSLGPRSPETEAIFSKFSAGKSRARERESSLSRSLHEFAGMARGVMLNRVPAIVTATLRKLDEFGLLGKNFLVIGTNALYGYESAADVRLDSALLATGDIDLLWDARSTLKLALLDDVVAESGVLAILRKIDKSFEPTSAHGFRAVNNAGFYVDLVKQTPSPPWKNNEPTRLANGDITPSWLPNIKWLLSSEKFRAIVIGQDGLPAPMVSPDPRAFAVYKKWLSEQPDREPGKKMRDQQQAIALIELVRERFPNLPLDDNAERMFPAQIRSLSRGNGFSL